MGINNFSSLLKKCPNGKRDVPLTVFSGKRVAIDTDGLIYAILSNVWSTLVGRINYPWKQVDMQKFMQRCLLRLKDNLETFLLAGVTPVYVFDGPPPPEKNTCRANRQADRRKRQQKHEELLQKVYSATDSKMAEMYSLEAKKQATNMFPVNGEIMSTMKEFLTVMGVPVIESSEEAERLCAHLCLTGYCSAVYTKDRDTLVHGAPVIITGFDRSSQRSDQRAVYVNIIELMEVLIDLNISYQHFVDLCIMCGCDYNEREGKKFAIPYVGPGRAYPLIVKYGSIENIPIPDIVRFFKTYVNKNPEYQCYLSDPKPLLRTESCRKRFGPIPLEHLISDYDLEADTLSQLSLKSFTVDTGEFLGRYSIDNILGKLDTLYYVHPKIPAKDHEGTAIPNLLVFPNLIIYIGVRHKELWHH